MERKETVLKGEQMAKNNFWFRRTTLAVPLADHGAATSPRPRKRRVRRKRVVQALGASQWGFVHLGGFLVFRQMAS